MKFKITVMGLLSAILATCIFTAYELTTEAKKQTELQLAQTEGTLALIEMQDNINWMKNAYGEWEPILHKTQYDEDIKAYTYIYNADEHYLNSKGRLDNFYELN